jgi:hypothetical protein
MKVAWRAGNWGATKADLRVASTGDSTAASWADRMAAMRAETKGAWSADLTAEWKGELMADVKELRRVERWADTRVSTTAVNWVCLTAGWTVLTKADQTAVRWAASKVFLMAAASDCLKVVHWGATMAALTAVNLVEQLAAWKGVLKAVLWAGQWGDLTADWMAATMVGPRAVR